MAIKKHKLNIEKSQMVFNTLKRSMQKKECYINVFNVTSAMTEKFISGQWRIAYGYYPTNFDNMYARHCFILDENGEAIDPTLPLQEWRDMDSISEYISFKIFSDFSNYLDAVKKNNLDPSLDFYLVRSNAKAFEWANENGYVFMG